jgi:hypothetical protein
VLLLCQTGGLANIALYSVCSLPTQTYFTATLFTDAGIDLYVRGSLSDEEYNNIVEALRAHQGDTEADKEFQKLAKDMFKIPVGNI